MRRGMSGLEIEVGEVGSVEVQLVERRTRREHGQDLLAARRRRGRRLRLRRRLERSSSEAMSASLAPLARKLAAIAAGLGGGGAGGGPPSPDGATPAGVELGPRCRGALREHLLELHQLGIGIPPAPVSRRWRGRLGSVDDGRIGGRLRQVAPARLFERDRRIPRASRPSRTRAGPRGRPRR